MRILSLCVLVAIVFVSSCNPTPQPNNPAATGCAFAPNQNANDLRLNCTVQGDIGNLRVDPFVAGNAPCGLNSWTIFNQTINTPMVAIYGQNGDDSDSRVRVGVTIGPGTHSGKIAKDNPTDNCNTTVGAQFDINTSFAGTHVALVDKGRNPMCVFQSRLDLTTFTQTLTAGVPLDISGMTKDSTRDSLHKRIDLEVARAVNRLLRPNANVGNSGRCPNDWTPFTGN